MKSCEELIQESTNIAKISDPVIVHAVLQNKIKNAWWQNELLMVQYKGEWSEPSIATDKEYQILTGKKNG